MNMKLLVASVVSASLLLVGGVVAFASNQATSSPTQVKVNAKPHPVSHVRTGKLKELNIVSDAAAVLKVKPIYILDEMKKGKTLVQIAQSKGLTEAVFMQKLTDVEKQKINDALKNGQLAPKQAAELLAGVSDRMQKNVQLKAVDVQDHMAMDMSN